jgi:1,2-diacylglycerol 3-alpha-glucosyltransferase
LHILMISDVYFPRVNGVSTSIRTFRNELVSLGHEVTLIAPQYGPETQHEDWIIRVPSRAVPMDPEDRFMNRDYISALANDLKWHKYDLLHIQTPFVAHYAGIELSRKLGLPRLVTYHKVRHQSGATGIDTYRPRRTRKKYRIPVKDGGCIASLGT